MRRGRIVCGATLAVSALVAACEANPENGVLGNGTFAYDCSNGQGDSYCSQGSGGGTLPLPNEIAVGAAFTVDYQPNGDIGSPPPGGASSYDITSASSELALSMGNTVVAQRSGYDALLATHSGVSTIDDFVHVEFVNVASITPSASSVQVQVGASQSVWVTPQDSFGTSMAGRLGCTWSVTSGEGVVTVPGTKEFGAVQVNGVSDGTATVQASCAQASASITVTVSGTATGDGGVDGASGDAGVSDASGGEGGSGG